ncbi:MAG: hypothetical protein IPG67_18715 [Acidobacteria bacterium]|nr:hypothetical protein [Acidobacteriota bacterium]
MSRMIAELTEDTGKLTGDLSNRINDAIAEFSLDKEDSALSLMPMSIRLKRHH